MPALTTLYCPSCNSPISLGTKFCASCGYALPQPEEEAKDRLVGKIVGGRFRVETKLGEGGMGAVYQAEQVAMKRKVALKVLHPHLAQDQDLVERFHREAGAAARLSHPNTITVHDFGQNEEDGTLYIAMEFVEGKSLADEITAVHVFPWTRALHICLQIAESLADAHAAGIVHRDLKPDNVMLINRAGQSDFVKLLDFGIAKVAEATEEGGDKRKALTRTGMIFGTPQYMSPEQIRGSGVDHRTDIYALGVILYQLLTGQLPFQAENPMGMLTKHLMEPPRPMIHAHPGIDCPMQLQAVVMRCLEKDPGRRYQSMNELVRELSAFSGDTRPGFAVPTGAQPAGAAPRALTTDPGTLAPGGAAPFARGGVGTLNTQGSGGFAAPGSGGFAAPGSGGFAAPGSGGFAAPGSGGFAAPGSGGFAAPGSGGFAGQTSSAGFTPAPAVADSGGGGAGKVVAIIVAVVFVLGGLGAGGVFAWRAISGGSDDTDGENDVATTNPPVVTPPVTTPPVVIPPVTTPPVVIPPVGTPPVGTPPLATPPIGTPPAVDDALKGVRCSIEPLKQGRGEKAKASDESDALARALASRESQITLCLRPLLTSGFEGEIQLEYQWGKGKGPHSFRSAKNTLTNKVFESCLKTVIQGTTHPESKNDSRAIFGLAAAGGNSAVKTCKVSAGVPARSRGKGPKPPTWVPGQQVPVWPSYPNYGY
jgi:serine/threonine-protein kinase